VHVQFEPSAVSVSTGASVNSIFTEAFFTDTFQPFAQACNTKLASISLPKHNHTRKLKGVAFVHFGEEEGGERAAIMALQTLTNQFQQVPQPQHLQSASAQAASAAMAAAAAAAAASSPAAGASYGGQDGTSGDGAQVQTHLLGGIPVKYSFGKRQIFSRHRRANEGAAGTATAAAVGAARQTRATTAWPTCSVCCI